MTNFSYTIKNWKFPKQYINSNKYCVEDVEDDTDQSEFNKLIDQLSTSFTLAMYSRLIWTFVLFGGFLVLQYDFQKIKKKKNVTEQRVQLIEKVNVQMIKNDQSLQF